MRRVLLTSSQVSVLASSAIVVACTLALFFTGYALQQRTLRELRVAIRPRESPKAYLPDQFQSTTTGLEDETVLLVARGARELRENTAIEVTASTAEIETPREEEEPAMQEEPARKEDQATAERPPGKATKEQMAILEKIKTQVAEKSWAVENPDPLSKNRAPLTRAERRKMIKDEIKRLAQSDKPIYYQRRLW